MRRVQYYVGLVIVIQACGAWGGAESALRDFTNFQTASPYTPELDIGSDVAIVYGVDRTFPDRVQGWREAGYTVSMMTGIAWGGYESYYLEHGELKRDEIQTDKSGTLFMHGNSETVGYNVPTPAYIEYIKHYITPAIDAGVPQIFLEEPEFWARTGWSKGFQEAWQRYYGEAWQPPDSSVDAQYRASRLKYELYFDALKEVTEFIDAQAAKRGAAIECIVPTHSLINYAHWRIVSPESYLMDLKGLDGYVAQVWTGTARTPNVYQGARQSRTFETAYLEYGQMLSMVKPTGRKVWFLTDPVEDNPNRTWADYKLNYEATVIASLMWPEVHRFEVMPWPNRIFRGTYPDAEMTEQASARVGIAADYATQILIVINALNDMKQDDIRYDTGTRGIGVVVSDSMMFQRADPTPSDADLSFFYGLALPLLKHGVPVEVAQFENALEPGAFDHLHTLLLTYEGQKPLKPEYHAALATWVTQGGSLIYAGDGSDPYHRVREWWNDRGATEARPELHLFQQLGVALEDAAHEPQAVGEGWVRVLTTNPAEFTTSADAGARLRAAVNDMLAKRGESLKTQHYVKIQRGPYVVVSVLDESLSESTVTIPGPVVDLFDPALPVRASVELRPGERTLLYDLAWVAQNAEPATVIAAAARIRDDTWDGKRLTFTARGPKGTTARLRLRLPGPPAYLDTDPPIPVVEKWDPGSGTALLVFENTAQTVAFDLGTGG
jgi:hypothetical protein